MAPLRAACFAMGVVVSAAAAAVPGSPIYSLQGGGSGLEQEGDYWENKIARGVYGVFDTAADEAKQANKHMKDAAKSAKESVRDSGKHMKDAAKSARESVNLSSKIGWPFEEKAVEVVPPPKLSWIGGAKEVVENERHAVCKFFGNPNNAFLAQGLVALVFGGLHLFKHNEYGSKLAESLCNLFGFKFGDVTDELSLMKSPHINLVGAYLIGVLVSDVLAYKSNSAGFKRGKVWHELGTGIALSVVCIKELLSSDTPPEMMLHCILAVIFAGWFAYLSQEY